MPIYALGDAAPSVAQDAQVDAEAVVIGAVTIGRGACIRARAVLRGDGAVPIEIGADTIIEEGAVLHVTPTLGTVVGAGCTIGARATLEGCRIGDGAVVGPSSVVMHRAIIGEGAQVAEGSVVPNDMVVPAGEAVGGVPASPGGEATAELFARPSPPPLDRSTLRRLA